MLSIKVVVFDLYGTLIYVSRKTKPYVKLFNDIGLKDPKDFEHIDYQALCRRNGPTVLEVTIDPEEAPPIGMF